MTTVTAPTEPTLVTFLLDRSSSMSACWDATIEGFNGYVEELKKATTPISFTFLQFDWRTACEIHKMCFEMPIQDVPPIDKKSYQPRGSTPLIEAATKTIAALATAVAQKKVTLGTMPKVVVCIQTDGEENSSTAEYTWQRLKDLISEYTAKGWQFNFMGAGIDAYDQGAKMGIATAATMSYDHTDTRATRNAFRASASTGRMFASGQSVNTDYTMAQRASSGDKHANRVFGNQAQGAVPPSQAMSPPTPHPLDLTTGGSHSVTPNVVAPLDLTQ